MSGGTGTWLRRIFWIDGGAALLVGIFVLAFRRQLAGLYALPVDLITFMGLVNVGYSPLGLTLATRTQRRVAAVVGLATANYLWACVCAWLVFRFRHGASMLGLATLAFEGTFVAVLATIEWRNRYALSQTGPAPSRRKAGV